MALVSMNTAKAYLRVDTSDEDMLIDSLLTSATQLCYDVARLDNETIEAVEADATEDDSRELAGIRSSLVVAILFTLGYLFEHREEADHVDLENTVRALLYAVREGR